MLVMVVGVLVAGLLAVDGRLCDSSAKEKGEVGEDTRGRLRRLDWLRGIDTPIADWGRRWAPARWEKTKGWVVRGADLWGRRDGRWGVEF